MERLGARATPSVMFLERRFRLMAVLEKLRGADALDDSPTPLSSAVITQPPAMLVHPQFDPIALKLGPIAIHWYGLTYLVAFGLFTWLAALRVKQPQFAERGWTFREVEDMLFYG